MMELLAVALNEAADAIRMTHDMAKKSGFASGTSQFTAEELSTQVLVIKGRLMCPV